MVQSRGRGNMDDMWRRRGHNEGGVEGGSVGSRPRGSKGVRERGSEGASERGRERGKEEMREGVMVGEWRQEGMWVEKRERNGRRRENVTEGRKRKEGPVKEDELQRRNTGDDTNQGDRDLTKKR